MENSKMEKFLPVIDDIYDMELEEFYEYLDLRVEEDIMLWNNKHNEDKMPRESEFWAKISELKKIHDKLNTR